MTDVRRHPDGSGPGAAEDESVPTVLLSSSAHGRHGGRLSAIEPAVQWQPMSPEGDIGSSDGLAVVDPDLAWATVDLFDIGGLRPFMDRVRKSSRLRWLQWAGAGVERPIFRELVERGVRVTTTHASTGPIAEFVLRSVLECFQESWRWHEAASAGKWLRHDFREVDGSTWLIVGTGHIGNAVARAARGLGAATIGVRRNLAVPADTDQLVGPDELFEYLPCADVVVLAIPATQHTEDLVDRRFLAAMREKSVLVNIARGAVIDDDALIAALDHGRPTWAVLDTFRTEPLPETHPYWSHPRVRVTPHAAGMGGNRHERAADDFADNLRRWLRNQPLVNEVAEATWASAGRSAPTRELG